MSKHPLQLTNFLSLVYDAMCSAKKYESKAEDTGTETRNAKYLLTKILNKLNTKVEVSDQQAAMLLLGKRSYYTSHKFTYVFVWEALKNYLKHLEKNSDNEAEVSDDFENEDQSSDSENEGNFDTRDPEERKQRTTYIKLISICNTLIVAQRLSIFVCMIMLRL